MNLELKAGFKDESGFHCKQTVIVEASKVGTFLKQDDIFRSYPTIMIKKTSQAPTWG